MEKLLITQKQAADILSISVDTLDSLAVQEYLHKLHIGARAYYDLADVKSFVEFLKEAKKC